MVNIGICDDEKPTCAEMENMLETLACNKGIKIDVQVWYTGESLCRYLEKNTIDLLFLDIELISTDGIKVGKYIREKLDNMEMSIVYISSKSNYAMNLFQIQPFDFLIKPITALMIDDIITRWLKVYERKNMSFECYSKTQGQFYKLLYKDIIYFYSQNKKINVVLKNREVQFNGKLKEIAKTVPYNFCMIHQSFLVNLDYVAECSYEIMKMQNGVLLNISLPYRKSVREQMSQRIWEKMK